jgi:predicted alpha/beta-fold hydrolase
VSDHSPLQRARGHLWTLAPTLRTALRTPQVPEFKPFRAELDDQEVGAVSLTGALHEAEGAEDLLVVIHGLGGSIDSAYMGRPAEVALERGMGCLRLNLRGSDLSGHDIYHAALTADLEAALQSESLASYKNIYLLGFSMGGHMALRWALAPTDPRVRALCTICSPLDLAASCAVIDQPVRWLYRRHIVQNLKAIHKAGAWRGNPDWGDASGIKRISQWDARIVAPRFGFESAEAYWAETSVGPRLGELAVPALLLATELDPMVTEDTLRPSLANLKAPSEARWLVGGHVGVPSWSDVPSDALDWLQEHR